MLLRERNDCSHQMGSKCTLLLATQLRLLVQIERSGAETVRNLIVRISE
jgi:hypothetical protein